jgi:ribosome-binding protein aMBF1 (putative translation factor)
MPTPTHDPNIQQSPDGPLTEDFRQRVHAAKTKFGLNYDDIATKVGIAGSTLGNIVRYDTHNTSTKTANKLANVIGELEMLDGFRGEGDCLTIAEAKKRLAAAFGVTPEAIEITIRG